MERRVVITGLGAITPIGNNVDEFWKGIVDGKCGIDEITLFDTTDFKVKLAGEVKGFNMPASTIYPSCITIRPSA